MRILITDTRLSQTCIPPFRLKTSLADFAGPPPPDPKVVQGIDDLDTAKVKGEGHWVQKVNNNQKLAESYLFVHS